MMANPISYLELLRPRHWFKNLFLFAAPFFGGRLFDVETLPLALPAFAVFSLCASSVYIFNDLTDRGQDRLHPGKSQRPIASGAVGSKGATVTAGVLAVLSLLSAYTIDRVFFYFVLAYFGIHVVYSLHLKRIALVDIFCISSGFVIRVLAGGAIFDVEVSGWLLVTTFMISLVLASGKRLSEMMELKENANLHRESLRHYSEGFLKNMLLISSASSLICYSLYTIEQSRILVYTIPVVTFGLFRYLMVSEKGLGDATEALTRDGYLLITVLLWLLLVGILRY